MCIEPRGFTAITTDLKATPFAQKTAEQKEHENVALSLMRRIIHGATGYAKYAYFKDELEILRIDPLQLYCGAPPDQRRFSHLATVKQQGFALNTCFQYDWDAGIYTLRAGNKGNIRSTTQMIQWDGARDFLMNEAANAMNPSSTGRATSSTNNEGQNYTATEAEHPTKVRKVYGGV